MIYFSYNDFSDCIENGKIDEIKRVEERISKYELRNGKNENTENNIIKILKDKYELKKFLTEFLKLDFNQLGYDTDIRYYNYIKAISDKEQNNILIAKIKEKEIFILIKQINKIDSNIFYKMFEHTINIIKKWNDEERKENKRKPIVIPIVIYTGKDRWKNFSNIHSKNINYTTWKEHSINFFYNTIQLNDLNVENLKQLESKVAEEFIKVKY